MTAPTAQQFIDEARKMVGTRYLHQGRSARGVDCIGFFVVVANQFGIDLTKHSGGRFPAYGRLPSPSFLETVVRYAVPLEKPIPGAGLLIKFPKSAWPQHTVIFTERDTIIHAWNQAGIDRVVEHGYRGIWLRLTHSVWKIPGVDYGAP